MRFRLGLGIGFAAGYVLGSKAGKERYEQIRRAARGMWDSGAAADLRGTTSRVFGRIQEHIPGNGSTLGRTVDLTDRVEPYVVAAHVYENPPLP